jgi:hypothetical protein
MKNHFAMMQNAINEITVSREACIIPIFDVVPSNFIATLRGAFA